MVGQSKSKYSTYVAAGILWMFVTGLPAIIIRLHVSGLRIRLQTFPSFSANKRVNSTRSRLTEITGWKRRQSFENCVFYWVAVPQLRGKCWNSIDNLQRASHMPSVSLCSPACISRTMTTRWLRRVYIIHMSSLRFVQVSAATSSPRNWWWWPRLQRTAAVKDGDYKAC